LEDEDIIFLETESRSDVARALAEAERAIEAVQEKHRKSEGARPVAVAAPEPEPARAPPEPPVPDPRLAVLEDRVAKERERALRAEEDSGRVREALLRKSADFDNLKRRTEKDKAEYFRFALAEAFADILNVVDNFERALAHRADATGDEFHAGIDMIARQLADTLKKYGVVEVPASGLPFDPNVHEAVVRGETESTAPGTVLEVLQKGYLLNDRLLRPARVKVATPRAAGEAKG
ncbi:MAG TPA: nucleotide exchange factor GrpE, partial [Thermoanaerobaculia bacterium]|nr:nucleotide exchange factor GrpE [Thermoanaerobaculia bacterium]